MWLGNFEPLHQAGFVEAVVARRFHVTFVDTLVDLGVGEDSLVLEVLVAVVVAGIGHLN